MRAEEETLSWDNLAPLIKRLEDACAKLDLEEIRSVLMKAVDGFEPKEEVSDPQWRALKVRAAAKETDSEAKITKLFK
jgi:hypothetical protein